MKSLKKKFGKFAISQTKAKQVNGGMFSWGYDDGKPCECPITMICPPKPEWCPPM